MPSPSKEEVSKEEVHSQLAAILASDEFEGSKIDRCFLTFAVKEGFASRVLLAAEVARELVKGAPEFKYSENDVKGIRTTASHVRSRLSEYYKAHPSDRLIIELPPGQYKATWREPQVSHPQKGEFALCIPNDDFDISEFHRELQFWLYQRLLVDHGSLADPLAGVRGMHNFCLKLKAFSNRDPLPTHLLIIWPQAIKKGDPRPQEILAVLHDLAGRGCRIAALNEFHMEAFKDFDGRLRLIKTNGDAGIKRMAEYVRKRFKGGRALLLNAGDDYQSAVEREKSYKRHLKSMLKDEEKDSIRTHSWEYQDSRKTVFKHLSEIVDSWDYDVIVAANDAMGLGATDALDEYCWRNLDKLISRKSKVLETKVVGFDGLPSAIRRLQIRGSRFVATLAAGPREIVQAVFIALAEDKASNPIFHVQIAANALRTDEHPDGE